MIKRNRLYFLLAIALIGIIIAGITFLWVFRKTPDNVKTQAAVFETEATQLAKEFSDDEAAANTKFLGKVILVSGTIDSFDEDKEQNKFSVTLKEKGSESGVICEFTLGNIDTQLLQTGSKMKIKGICNGYLFDVVLTKCTIDK